MLNQTKQLKVRTVLIDENSKEVINLVEYLTGTYSMIHIMGNYQNKTWR
ncbi:MAG TPA: hypothetical protein VJH20_02270 [Candidatus Nanoarchaeia archaeon]|nr:hypothetical protein [Candidatus Nanoarchaeia archaeon]